MENDAVTFKPVYRDHYNHNPTIAATCLSRRLLCYSKGLAGLWWDSETSLIYTPSDDHMVIEEQPLRILLIILGLETT